ncbi:Uncharacterised protein [Mycobacterium tuberculosis]|uniref:Uncharacterized protein n=1 Tax=Mycobacterium tuberculosis TaxID=1773 RepID=A0A655FUA5_MYCTX|nr:Uncharacterised protein [Mycobacterium tuberculosis]COX91106.1 Uncharacterised protein [Mycobacterium tuberculosis]COY30669.1 Uncharacterised protein [Mycobacterium tuberculosis]
MAGRNEIFSGNRFPMITTATTAITIASSNGDRRSVAVIAP